MQELSLRDGVIVFPEGDISGRIRVPIRVFGERWWSKERDGGERAMMRREGLRVVLEFGEERNKKGEGRGGEGGVKLLRSSMKNREGGGNSVSTSSMAFFDYYLLSVDL